MSTTWSEDSPNHRPPAEVEATPVEGLDREPSATDPAATKKATADTKVVEAGQVENKAVSASTNEN